MHGLQTIRRMNAQARLVTNPPPMAMHVQKERYECINAAWRNYHAGSYTMAQLNEELADIKATYE